MVKSDASWEKVLIFLRLSNRTVNELANLDFDPDSVPRQGLAYLHTLTSRVQLTLGSYFSVLSGLAELMDRGQRGFTGKFILFIYNKYNVYLDK